MGAADALVQGRQRRQDTIPEPVRRFLASANNRRRLVAVIGSGNRNFGEHYQRAARDIAAASGRPVLFEFELSGTARDTDECRALLEGLDARLAGHDA
jgi:protein involved in ribonucleotide reduction